LRTFVSKLRLTLKLSLARLRFHFKKSLLQQASVAVLLLSVGFFLAFSLGLDDFRENVPEYGLPDLGDSALAVGEYGVGDFLDEVVSYMGVAILLLIPLSLITFYCLSRLRSEESKSFYSRLESIGASGYRRTAVFFTETLLTFLLPIIIGSGVGILLGKRTANGFAEMMASDYIPEVNEPLIWLAISFVGFLTVFVFSYSAHFSRGTLIERLKKHNRREVGERHGYRESFTFRHMPIEKRIAKKSLDYYRKSYSRIATVFAVTFYYPMLAFLFFYTFESINVVADANPFDGIDTDGLVFAVMSGVGIFCVGIFSVLFLLGILQLVSMLRTQNKIREESLSVYKTVGMTDEGVKRVIRQEYLTCAFWGTGYLLGGILLTLIFLTLF